MPSCLCRLGAGERRGRSGSAPGRLDLHRKFGIHSVAHVVAYADGYVLTMRHAWYPSRAENDKTQTQAQDPDPYPGPDAADPDPDPGPRTQTQALLYGVGRCGGAGREEEMIFPAKCWVNF